MAYIEKVSQRLSFEGNPCTVRFVGEVAGTTGTWLGVEWDDPTRGKHNGRHKGHRYFTCRSNSPTAASFVRPTRPADKPHTFLSALQLKYASGVGGSATAPEKQIVISGKIAEEVGFEKIRRQQAQLSGLKIIILDGAQVISAYPPGDSAKEKGQSIRDICPKVTDLDLSRNLFNRFRTVVEICSELEHLRTLRVNGNCFVDGIVDDRLEGAEEAFKNIKELSLEETNLEWEEICHIASKFPSLISLNASSNLLPSLSPIPESSFTSTLLSLNLEYNNFTSLSDLAPLSAVTSLRNLQLKGNKFASSAAPYDLAPAPVFATSLHYLDISYNNIATWAFVDDLPVCFPGMTSLRIAHNPIYDNPDLDDPNATAAATPAAGSADAGVSAAPSNEAAYMFMIARLPQLKALNFGSITAADRTDAEMFYLGRIARQLAAVPEDKVQEVLERHPRWQELCDEYGEPAVVRRKEVNPNFLEARLIEVKFYLEEEVENEATKHVSDQDSEKKRTVVERGTKVPKSFDVYAVKGIAGRLFGLPPLKLRLIWETGEWDPVAGFDEEVGDSSEDEELEAERGKKEQDLGSAKQDENGEKKAGRWVKREVELRDGPRQFGYCVDGLEVRVRVESR